MHSGNIWAQLVSISSHRQQSKWYMRVIRCVTIVSRKVFFSLRLCSLVSLISELRDCPLSKTKPEKIAEILPRYHWFPREISCEERAEKFHTDDATLPRFASDWLKQICHTARPMRSTGICARSSDVISRDETRDGIPKTELIDILVTFLFLFFFRLKS